MRKSLRFLCRNKISQTPCIKEKHPFYSGKKKRHTIKTEIRINPKGRIVHVSKTKTRLGS